MSSTRAAPPTILVLGSYHTSIVITRQLGRAGYRVVVERRRGDPSFADRSRHAAETWEHAIGDREQELCEQLPAFLAKRPDISLLFPVLDDELMILARHHDELSKLVRPVMATPKVIDTCESKIELMRLASKIGVPQTAYALAADRSELFREADRIGYPCVVKPPNSLLPLFGKKALIFRDGAALRAAFASWPDVHPTLIVQRFAHGQRYDVHALADRGRLLAALQTRVLRTDRWDGTGITVEAVTVPLSQELRRQCELLAEALDLTGPAYLQFHCDEERGTSHLLEVNPRLGVNFAIAARCGWNLPASAVRLALDEPLPESETGFSYPLDQRYAWTFGDFAGLKRELRFRQIGVGKAAVWLARLAAAFLRADTHVTWSWRDPLPTLATYLSPLARRLGRQGPTTRP